MQFGINKFCLFGQFVKTELKATFSRRVPASKKQVERVSICGQKKHVCIWPPSLKGPIRHAIIDLVYFEFAEAVFVIDW
jgi:hypothetical protein